VEKIERLFRVDNGLSLIRKQTHAKMSAIGERHGQESAKSRHTA